MLEYQHIASICPNDSCDNVIKIKQGGFPIINDTGGWKLKCKSCNEVFIIHILNPADASYVESGADLIEVREGTLDDTEKWCADDGINIKGQETLTYEPEEFSPIEFHCDKFPLYISDLGENLEEIAYRVLSTFHETISSLNNTYYNFYVKGRNGDPKYCYVFLDFKSQSGDHTAVFYYTFSHTDGNSVPQNNAEFLLAEITNSVPLDEHINGIYTRDNCLSYLNKLLIRWRGLYKYTLLVVPFVGYLNQNASTRIELWDNIKKFLKEPNSFLLTRHIAKSLLEKSEQKLGKPVDLIKRFDLESTSFENMDLFLMFHAKFFGGINEDHSEILKGSFNIQKNSFYENIDLQKMPAPLFQTRYLDPLKITLTDKETLKDAIYIDLRKDKKTVNVEFNYGSGFDFIYKMLK